LKSELIERGFDGSKRIFTNKQKKIRENPF
jgi:hypothetical protein